MHASEKPNIKPIRNSIKAIIIKNRKLLTIEKEGEEGVYYLLPGGGQQPGETVHQALLRECLEEVGMKVVIGELIYVRDYIAKNHEFATTSGDFHQVELMFKCEIMNGTEKAEAILPDDFQIGIKWIPLEEIDDYQLYPAILKTLIRFDELDRCKIYLGDVN